MDKNKKTTEDDLEEKDVIIGALRRKAVRR